MKLVRQPTGSNQCGQACVATLCGLTLDEAIALMGTKGKTRTKQLVEALLAKSVICGCRLKRGFPPDDQTAILKFKHSDGQGHWVVWHKGKYYDPQAGVFRQPPKYLARSRVTSYLTLEYDPVVE